MQLTTDEQLDPAWPSPNQPNMCFNQPPVSLSEQLEPLNEQDSGCLPLPTHKTCQTSAISHKSDMPSFRKSQLTADYNTFRGGKLIELPYLHHFNSLFSYRYIECFTAQRFATVQKFVPGAHLEVRRGSQAQAIQYCSKTHDPTFIDGPYEYGSPTRGQGARADLETLKECLDSGKSLLEISDSHFGLYLRHSRTIQEYQLLHSVQSSRRPPRVSFYFGPSGTGKSAACMASYPEAYWKPQNQWWDGYRGQECVIFDDYYGGLPYHQLLRLVNPLRMNRFNAVKT